MSRMAVCVLVTWCLLAACVADPNDASLPAVDLFEQPVADAPDPADRAGAAADFIDCEYGISQGGWSMDFGPPGSAPHPDGALARFLEFGLFALPRQGFVAVGRDEDRMLYTYSVAGEPKAAVIVADSTTVPLGTEGGWVVETFAACDPAEFDPSVDDELPVEIWVDADGNRVPTSIVTSSQGPQHCDWESVTFLWFEDSQYISDPRRVLSGVDFVAPFDDDSELPSNAIDTGYQREGRQLWVSADGSVAYLVDDNRVEAWPTSTDLVGCA
jgi:hypothetical protein